MIHNVQLVIEPSACCHHIMNGPWYTFPDIQKGHDMRLLVVALPPYPTCYEQL